MIKLLLTKLTTSMVRAYHKELASAAPRKMMVANTTATTDLVLIAAVAFKD